MEKPKHIPKWGDKDALAKQTKLVAEIIEEVEKKPHIGKLKLVPASEFYKAVEREAVEAAKCGNIVPLAMLLHPNYAYNTRFGTPIRSTLSSDTWDLVTEFLTGGRNIQTGKRPRVPGPRKKTAEQRRAMNPVHDAADEFPLIRGILQWLYPDQTHANINDRARTITAKRHGLKYETLKLYLDRSRNDRHRVHKLIQRKGRPAPITP